MNKIFQSRQVNGSLYILLSVIGFVATFALNLSHKLAHCSMWFTIIVLVINMISELFSKKLALATLLASVVLSFILMRSSADLLLAGSFISVIVACYASLSIKALGGFQMRNLIGLSLAAIIDSLMMFATFTLLSSFTSEKITSILFKDLMFKFSYISAVAICIFIAVKIVDHRTSLFRA